MHFNEFEYPNELENIFDKLKSLQLRPIIVGGYVRDFFLAKKSKDIDIEVYGLSNINALILHLKEFGDVHEVGKSFGVCKLSLQNLDIDFSMPRIDNKVSTGHRGFEVTTKKQLDFKTASSRRDFTINAIGYDVQNKKILDPFNGLDDLKDKILRLVDKNSFIEDPLRVFRAMGMVARFDLKVEENTLSTCTQMVKNKLLHELAKERIYEEFKKLFLKSKRPSLGLEFLKNIGAKSFFPELIFEGELYSKTLSYLDKYQTNKSLDAHTNFKLMLVLLCYSLDADKIDSFLAKLTNKKNLSQEIQTTILNLKLLKEKQDTYTLRKIAIDSKISDLCLLLDAQGYESSSIYEKAKQEHILNTPMPMLLTGKDLLKLQLKPSPKFSSILSQAYEAQLHSKFHTKAQAQVWLQKYLS